MSKLLLIVDPQYDFIDGSLPVEGAGDAMSHLADFINGSNDYIFALVTTDWHPWHHTSFVDEGGEWPRHCVQNTTGAAIYQAIVDALNENNIDYDVLRKGNEEDREEYSVFKNAESAEHFKRVVTSYKIDQIDICGIAGDICVLNTLKDGIKIFGKEIFHVLEEYCPSIDKGTALHNFIEDEGL